MRLKQEKHCPFNNELDFFLLQGNFKSWDSKFLVYLIAAYGFFIRCEF